MDAISNFLLQKKNLTIPVLFSTLYHLQVIQLQQPNLSFSDLEETLKTVSGNNSASNLAPIAEDEIKTYAGIIYEACTVPKMGVEGPMFSLDEALTLGDQSEHKLLERFLKVFSVRDSKLGGKYSSVIEEWRKEGKKFVQQESSTERDSSDFEEDLDKLAIDTDSSFNHASLQHQNGNHVSSYVPRTSLNSNAADNSRPFTGPIESNKFVARFLAHMRRSGMDMVFPQLIHDKVLLTVYIAAKCSGPIAHRDLIDMILAAKDSQVLGNDLELVSKTKVRGVVTLARNSHALIVVEKGDGQGETVKLAVGKGISTFKAFRKMHDSFLNLCLSQRHLFLPVNVKGEILWASDEKFAAERCHELMRDEAILESFFLTGGKKSSPTFASSESKTSFESSRSMIGLSLPKQESFSLGVQKPVTLPSTFGYEVSKPSNTFDFSESSFGSYGNGNRGFLNSSNNTSSEQFSFGSSALARSEFSHSRYNDEKDLGGFSSYGNITQNNNSLNTLVHGHGQSSQGGHLQQQSRNLNSGFNNNSNYYHNASAVSPSYRTEERSSFSNGNHLSSHHNESRLNENTPFATYSTYYSAQSASNNYKF